MLVKCNLLSRKWNISISLNVATCFPFLCFSARQVGFVDVLGACVCVRHNAAKIGFFLCPEWLHAEDCCWLGRQALARPLGTNPEL